MIFLIEYHRATGKVIALTKFADSERTKAERARLELELSLLGRPVDHEVVLLEAEDEEALRRTHWRYFGDLAGLAEALRTD